MTKTRGASHCDGVARRELLRVGAIGMGGLTLPGLLRLQELSASPDLTAARAKSVVILYLSGGPSQFDMWDMMKRW